MTAEEIKQNTSMRDVLAMYGIKARGNVCCCPIHHERHPSMQIFQDGYKCHACQSHGDIFSFVMAMENCSFRDAFVKLGGTYEHSENKKKNRLIHNKLDRQKRNRDKVRDFEKEFREMIDYAIFKCKIIIHFHEPFSDSWCDAQNALPWLEYVWDLKYIDNEEINKADVIRVCKRIEGIRHFV